MNRLILPILAFAFICLALSGDAFACSCTERPTIAEQLERYSDIVVTGRVESVDKIREEERKYDHAAYRSATLLVEKVYVGNVKVGDRLILAQGSGSDCSFTWEDKDVGKKWLFYLGQPSTGHYQYLEDAEKLSERDKVPMYGTSFCGRSNGLAAAARDIAYLDKMAKLKGKTRVSGDLEYLPQSEQRSVEGIEVRLTGKGVRLKTKYVKGGFFEFYDVPPGEYLLEVMAPSGWKAVNDFVAYRRGDQEFDAHDLAKLKKNQRYIWVAPGGHTDVDLFLDYDTRVSVAVLSPTGKPMANVCLRLEMAGEDADHRDSGNCSDNKGEFKFDAYRPGNYFLVVNPSGKLTDRQPFGRFYYPSAASREMAGVISVEAGKYNTGIEVQIPQLSRLVEVSGRVLFTDDKPGKEIWVRFEPTDQDRFTEIRARTDQDGRFQMKVPFGAAGTLQSSDYFREYSYSQCPEIMAFTKASGATDVKTTSLEITGTEPSITAALRLPFGFCENEKK